MNTNGDSAPVVVGRQLAAFVALTFAMSWTIWTAMAVASISIATPVGWSLNVIAIAGPSIAALVAAWASGTETLRTLLLGFSFSRASMTWLAVALLLPMAMAGTAIAISVAVFGAPQPIVTIGVLGVLAVEYVRILFLGGPLGEELGWRGFALPRLQRRLSAFLASLLVGVIWGLWHIPLYFVPGTGQSETLRAGTDLAFAIGAFVFWTVGLSVLFTWVFNRTGGSLLVVMVFHAAVNLGAFLPAAVGSIGAASMFYALVTWIVALVVKARYGRATLGSSARSPAAAPS